jgi:hypothetical protein
MPEIWDYCIGESASIPRDLKDIADTSYRELCQRASVDELFAKKYVGNKFFGGDVSVVCSTKRNTIRKWWGITYSFGDIADRVHIQRRSASWAKKMSGEALVNVAIRRGMRLEVVQVRMEKIRP